MLLFAGGMIPDARPRLSPQGLAAAYTDGPLVTMLRFPGSRLPATGGEVLLLAQRDRHSNSAAICRRRSTVKRVTSGRA